MRRVGRDLVQWVAGRAPRGGPEPGRAGPGGAGPGKQRGGPSRREAWPCKSAASHGGRHGGGEHAWGCGSAEPPALVPRPRSPQEPQDSPEPEARQPRVRDTPEDICLEATANAIALHPARPLLAAGDVDGDVYL